MTSTPTQEDATVAASTIPARLANMVPGTIPAGTTLRGFGRVLRASLTAYEVDCGGGRRAWVPFVHVHNYKPAEPLVRLG